MTDTQIGIEHAPLLTIGEAARRLAVSERSIWRIIAAGRLPVVRVGAAPRIDPGDLRRYIEARKQRTTARNA
jgi:excisionase family DNA binding protein